MPIYEYEHPKTKEIFEDIRTIKNRDKLFVAPDGAKCKRVKFPSQMGYCGKGTREVYELDPHFCKQVNPKYIKLRSGEKIRYDPTKHC